MCGPFTSRRSWLSVRRQPDDHLLLVVRDNGKGLPADFDVERSNTLGIRLMKGLSEDYDGKFRITSGEGTTVTLWLPLSGARELAA